MAVLQDVKAVLTETITAAATLVAGDYVTHAGAKAGAAAAVAGVAMHDAVSGETLTIMVIGSFTATASAAITAGAALELAASSKVVTINTGKFVGKAFNAASADGDPITVWIDATRSY